MDIRHLAIAVLLFAGLIVLVTVVERLHDAGGASQWAPRQAPRYADGTPDYTQIGRDYLAEEEDEDEPQYCPACYAVAREHGEEMAPQGEPRICVEHHLRLAEWVQFDPHALVRSTVIVGLLRYAERVTSR